MAKKVKETKTKESKRKQPERFEQIEVRRVFSETEKLNLLDELSRSNAEVDSISESKKNSSSEWANRLKIAQAKVRQLSGKAQTGYEMRSTDCRVEFDPAARKKTYFNKETNEEVETRDMTPADFELDLFIDAPLNPVSDAFDRATT